MQIQKLIEKGLEVLKQRKQTTANEITWLGGRKMSQARTLNEKELKLLLLFINTRKYAARDRAMVLMTYYAGMRIGETVAVKIGDVLAADGTIKQEIRLTAEQTKGKYGRTVVLSEKLRKELQTYLQHRYCTKQLSLVARGEIQKALFYTQKRDGFNANTGAYHMHMLYKAAGITGASSHSGRRSFLTTLSSKSVPLKVMMELAGHRQAQTTMRYVDVTTDMKKAAVELI
jgi:integrase/recombinase XerD